MRVDAMNRELHKVSQAGFTLVELMIGLLLGMLLTIGVVTLFVQSRQSFLVDENVARMQDQARFAMNELARDIRMAGFVTEALVPGGVTLDTSLAVDDANGCGPAAPLASVSPIWILRLTDAGTGDANTLTAVDNATAADAAAAYSCIDAGEFVDGTDVVAVKRAAGAQAAATTAGTVYIRSNGTSAMLFKEPPDGVVFGPTNDWEYRPRIYFIRNYSVTPEDGIPSLCRKVLVAGDPVGLQTDCIAQGIEDLQIEYGIDPDGDGNVNQYVPQPTLTDMQNAVTARISVLARTVVPDRSYTDDRHYALSNAADHHPNDNFHRRVYSVTVTLHNLRNLRRLGI